MTVNNMRVFVTIPYKNKRIKLTWNGKRVGGDEK